MFYANPTGSTDVHDAMTSGVLAFIDTPAQGNKRMEGVNWCADNGCFGSNFNEAKWWQWLQDNSSDASHCAFATAPDVVGDAQATLARSLPWLPKIRALGYPAAFVAQDGLTVDTCPWDELDVLFIGGTTNWKLGSQARELMYEAKRRDKWVHVGRVNSLRRMRYCESLTLDGNPVVDSVDGTFLTYGPTQNLPRLLGWIRDLHEKPAMFGIGPMELDEDRYRWGRGVQA